MESFVFGEQDTYIPEIQKKIFYEARIVGDEVQIIMRGGPLEPIILTIKGKDLEVDDWWGWGAG